MSVWVYQDSHQVAKVGPERASWYVGWLNPEGKRRCKSCGPGDRGKASAEKLAQKVQAELIEGTYKADTKKSWADFQKEYEEKMGAPLDPGTQAIPRQARGNFARLVKLTRISKVT